MNHIVEIGSTSPTSKLQRDQLRAGGNMALHPLEGSGGIGRGSSNRPS